MIKALLRDKVVRDFNRSPYEIEDLLTSVVLGGCSYLSPEAALLPFLRHARSCDGARHGTTLDEALSRVTAVEYEFWPWWRTTPACARDASDDEAAEPDEQTRACQPEVLLKMTRAEAVPAWVLVEVKLYSGKSSRPDTGMGVNDQLGKYWLALRRNAEAAGAEPLAVVYLTAHPTCPCEEFEETLQELRAKTDLAADEVVPLYWLSWWRFATAVPLPQGAAPLLIDLHTLLCDHWAFQHVEMVPWPEPRHRGLGWAFTATWSWPEPRACDSAWEFRASWSWEGRSGAGGQPPSAWGRWHFTGGAR